MANGEEIYEEWKEKEEGMFSNLKFNQSSTLGFGVVLVLAYLYMNINQFETNKMLVVFGIILVVFFMANKYSGEIKYLTEEQARSIANEQLKGSREILTLYEKGLPEGAVNVGIGKLLRNPSPPHDYTDWKFAVKADRGYGKNPAFFSVLVDAKVSGIGITGIEKLNREYKGDEPQVKIKLVAIDKIDEWKKVIRDGGDVV